MLNPVASSVLVGFYLFAGIFLMVFLGALTFALFKLNALLEAHSLRIQAMLENANGLIVVATEKVNTLSGKAEAILIQSEQVAETVHDKVEQTSGAVQRTINAPIIGLNSFAAGVSRGMKTFTFLQNQEVVKPDTKKVPDETKVPIAVPAAHHK